jgi:hypothetical protein
MIDSQSTAGGGLKLGALSHVGPGDLLRLAAQRKLGRKIDVSDQRQLRQAAVQLTSQLFFAPLLAEVRKSPLGEKFGGGGRTEEVFGEQLDQRMADAVASRNPGGMVGQIAKKLAARLEARLKAKLAAAGQSDANAAATDSKSPQASGPDLWAGLKSNAAATASEVR